MPKLITFNDIIQMPKMFYLSIGEDLYEHRNTNRLLIQFYRIYFALGFINANWVVVGEVWHFGKNLGSSETLLSAIAVGPCIGFSLVANCKQMALYVHKILMRQHFNVMEEMFPNNAIKQTEYRTQYHTRIMKRVMNIFAFLCLAYTTTFCIYPAAKYALMYYIFPEKHFVRTLCFPVWYPFPFITNTWIFWSLYLSQCWAAHVAGMAFIAADLLLVASITQLAMHYDSIVRRLEDFVWNDNVSEELNIRFLYNIVQYHAKCLHESENVNSIFGFTLLLNFLIASLTICFIGFEVTASTPEDIFKYCIFLMAELVQVFLVCYYGDMLMSSSIRVGDAAYNQIWFGASSRYKRMLMYIIERSQQPASIRPPTFPPISFNTYMKVISMSYQFFALLRTTYYDN